MDGDQKNRIASITDVLLDIRWANIYYNPWIGDKNESLQTTCVCALAILLASLRFSIILKFFFPVSNPSPLTPFKKVRGRSDKRH